MIPQVNVLGILNGEGLLIFYLSPSAQGAARRVFERVVEDMGRTLRNYSWDEIIKAGTAPGK
jgi:hypothetical protein